MSAGGLPHLVSSRQPAESGRLHRRPQAPEFRLHAYAVYPDESGSDAIAMAVKGMRQIAVGKRA